jgi:hypothetical protein
VKKTEDGTSFAYIYSEDMDRCEGSEQKENLKLKEGVREC